MKFHIVTLFPEMFYGPLSESIIGRAIEKELIETSFVNPRDFAKDSHRTVDAPPYGGGPGMVMMAQPLFDAVDHINAEYPLDQKPLVVFMSPQGERFTHEVALEFSALSAVTIVCGHYEGVDERFIENSVDREVSIGDFVLTGGEIPAMAVVDAIARLLPGVLGDDDSSSQESFSNRIGGMLEGPVYTRPAEVRGLRTPEELLTGDHAAVERYRRRSAAERTMRRRPDLMAGWGPPESEEDSA